MVEHVLKELGVALARHTLEGGAGEIAVIVADEYGNAAGDGGVNLVGSLAPLLHGVVEEDVLENVVGDLNELGIVLLTKLHDGNLFVLAESGHELLVKTLALLFAKGKLKRRVVEGNRHKGTVDVGEHLVLIIGPIGETREELVHAFVGGVIDVRAVLVDQDARLVLVVVGVARDVVAALKDGDLHATGLCKAARANAARIPAADNEGVIGFRVEARAETALDVHKVPLRKGTVLAD